MVYIYVYTHVLVSALLIYDVARALFFGCCLLGACVVLFVLCLLCLFVFVCVLLLLSLRLFACFGFKK